jgi:hypothetical protein
MVMDYHIGFVEKYSVLCVSLSEHMHSASAPLYGACESMAYSSLHTFAMVAWSDDGPKSGSHNRQ